MKTIKGIKFGGQYEENLERFLKGEEISVKNFHNGSWVATSKFGEFISRLDKIGYSYTKEYSNTRKNRGLGSLTIKKC